MRYKPLRVPMAPALVLPFTCVEDLKRLEHQLRELYQVEEHMPCEALLTTEYRMFRHVCLKKLRGTRCLAVVPEHAGKVDNVDKTDEIKAFLPGWHLCVTRNECQIQAFRPLVPVRESKADGSRKRNRDMEA